jgi:hypothetical protein
MGDIPSPLPGSRIDPRLLVTRDPAVDLGWRSSRFRELLPLCAVPREIVFRADLARRGA